jgi:hypothetical protein
MFIFGTTKVQQKKRRVCILYFIFVNHCVYQGATIICSIHDLHVQNLQVDLKENLCALMHDSIIPCIDSHKRTYRDSFVIWMEDEHFLDKITTKEQKKNL